MHYIIALQAGATLTENTSISAINLKGSDTLTIDGGGNADGGGCSAACSPTRARTSRA